MDVNDLLELLLAGRIRIKIEWDKIPVKCPHCEWSGEADTPKQAEWSLKDHLRQCPNNPLIRDFKAFLNDQS